MDRSTTSGGAVTGDVGVFVVDDDAAVRRSTERLVRSVGFDVQTFASAREFLDGARLERPGCLVLDVRMPGLSGLDLQRELAQRGVEIPIVFLTGHGDIPMTVTAMKAGAVEFLPRPFKRLDLLASISAAIEGVRVSYRARRELEELRERYELLTPRERDILPLVVTGLRNKQIAGELAASERTIKVPPRSHHQEDAGPLAARSRADGGAARHRSEGHGRTCLRGQVRTVHQRPAKQLHQEPAGLASRVFIECAHDARARRRPVRAAIGRLSSPRSLRARASSPCTASEAPTTAGGTLFLDEVGDLPVRTQVLLLRVLQEREFERVGGTSAVPADIRLVAATNRDLGLAVAEGTFRVDLYYRLDVFPLEMPPLRVREGDGRLLVEHFVRRSAGKVGKTIRPIDPQALELLEAYSWPGNVREIENVVGRSVIVCESATFTLDPRWLQSPPVPGEPKTPCPRVGATPSHSESIAVPESFRSPTLDDVQREAILRALSSRNWVIGGPRGAAALLGLKRTTLQARMQKLGIAPPRRWLGGVAPATLAAVADTVGLRGH